MQFLAALTAPLKRLYLIKLAGKEKKKVNGMGVEMLAKISLKLFAFGIMTLGSRQHKFLIEYFENKGLTLTCPACGKSKWEPDGITAIPFMATSGEGLDKKLTFQTVIMVCGECGYIMQFSAKKLGLA